MDSRFKIELSDSLKNMNLEFFDPREAPFTIHGLYQPERRDYFRRLPDSVAHATNEWVAKLYRDCAGGRIRFTTDSPYIAIHVEWPSLELDDNMSICGTSSFDLYEEYGDTERYHDTFRVPFDKNNIEKTEKGYDAVSWVDGKKKSYTIHMPLYNHVDSVYIGLKPGSVLEAERPYLPIKPVLFYGSSITQGGSASHAGNAYQNAISRELNIDHINLGFSGAGRAEETVVNFMTSLDISCFVSDYDHNAPTADHLDRTLRRMIARFRAAKPDLPIIMLTKPDFRAERPDDIRRRETVRAVYEEAVRNGDKLIRFIPGETFFPAPHQRDCTVDGAHPNDLGMRGMADVIGAAVKDALGL